MQRGGDAGATGASRLAAYPQRLVGTVMLTLAVTGCAGSGQSPFLANTNGASLALESIEGPPPAVFHKFVLDLTEEAAARQIAVAARGAAAPYRLRGYLATHAEAGTTSIAWVWDIYDGTERRAFRITGEERAGPGGKAWAAADDQVLRRIARASMEQVAAFIATAPAPQSPGPEVAAVSPEPGQSLLARIDDFRPEAAGIFRLFRSQPASIEIGADPAGTPPAEDIPLPRYRPAPIGGAPALAFAPEQ
jgi:hypothetical protein